VPEAVVDGVTGVLVPPADVNALAAACIALIRDPARREALGTAGRKFVLDNYQWEENAATMARVYVQLLAGGSVRTANMVVAADQRSSADSERPGGAAASASAMAVRQR
jgi:hypothetical protein